MDLRLDARLGAAYSSRAQIARVVTEDWVSREAYCPACISDTLTPTTPGTKVIDFRCENCQEMFQLKSQSHPFGTKVLDAAYGPMFERIERSSVPTFLFLH